MNTSQIYITISIVVLAIIALLVFFLNKNRKKKKLTPLTSLAFGFVLAGIFSFSIFGENKLIGYSLFGIAIILGVIDIIMKLKKK